MCPLVRMSGWAAPLILCACSTAPAPPLFFGEQVTVGINIGTVAGTQGVDFTLGYKDQDVAVVPVGAVSSGQGQAVTAHTRDGADTDTPADVDALSVFGQFEGQGAQPAGGGPTTRKVALGRFFATGLAASNLAEGYRDGWVSRSGGAMAAPVRSAAGSKPAATPPAATPPGKTQSGDQQPAVSQADAKDLISVPPLVFAQTNTLGIGMSTSVAEQGVQFSLGYTGRDIAFVPVMIRSADGAVRRLGGRHGAQGPALPYEDDALSVFGQFRVDTATEAVQFGLRRFFTTGMAARRLSEGFKGVIARELQAEQAAGAGSR